MPALDRGEWSASFPCPFNFGDRAPDSHWIGGSVIFRTDLNTMEKRKISRIRQELSTSSSACSLMPYRTRLSWPIKLYVRNLICHFKIKHNLIYLLLVTYLVSAPKKLHSPLEGCAFNSGK
jgi:hypothetical protein